MPARLGVARELVAGASSTTPLPVATAFLISATPNVQKQKTLADVEKGVWQLLDELKTTLPSAEELERVRARLSPAWSMTATPSAAHHHRPTGNRRPVLEADRQRTGRAQARYPQDIQNAARTYFTRERLSVAHVLPEESAHGDRRAPRPTLLVSAPCRWQRCWLPGP